MLEIDDKESKLSGFTLTLGYSRMLMAEAALDQKLGTVLRMHEEAFRQLRGVPEEILYDRMKTVWVELASEARSSGIRCFWILLATGVLRHGSAGRIEHRPKAKWSRASSMSGATSSADCSAKSPAVWRS